MNEIFDDDDEPTVKIANLEENMTVHVLNALVKSVGLLVFINSRDRFYPISPP